MSKKQAKQSRKISRQGEELACRFLKRKGFRIIEKNFFTRWGEIDIIAKDKDILVFVEVKTRTSDKFGSPFEAITPRKLRLVKRAAQFYCLLKKIKNKPLRIDAITILFKGELARVRHFENITF